MSVTSLLDLHFDLDRRDEGLAFLHRVLEGTRAFGGSDGVEVVVDVTDPAHVMVIERWASLSDDDAYREWRAGAGASALGEPGRTADADPVRVHGLTLRPWTPG